MKTKTMLCIILVAVLALLYLALKRSRDGFEDKKDPCDYMGDLDHNYSTDFVKGCKAYQAICGVGSTATDMLNISESYGPGKDADGAMLSDLADVQKDKTKCAPAGLCASNDDCHAAWGLTCKNVKCIDDDCQPGEECTPKKVCTGACM